MHRDEQWARERFGHARVARMATVSGDGSPHLVPMVFALDGDEVDQRGRPETETDQRAAPPRQHRGQSLRQRARRRVRRRTGRRLWWARADGWARVEHESRPHAAVARYPQYRTGLPYGPVVVIEIDHWSGWSARLTAETGRVSDDAAIHRGRDRAISPNRRAAVHGGNPNHPATHSAGVFGLAARRPRCRLRRHRHQPAVRAADRLLDRRPRGQADHAATCTA